MFNKKNYITICTDVKNAIDVEEFINQIKIYGVIDNYLKGDTIYISIVTNKNANRISKLLKEKLYKARTKVHGSVIFLEFES